MKLPDLTLPHSQGVVKFRDDDELTGRDMRSFRTFVFGELSASTAAARNRANGFAAALLIASWDVPGLPNLPKPVIDADGNLVANGLNFIHWRDAAAIDDRMIGFVNEIIFDLAPVADPKAPASDSEPLTE